jgi:hypothetical protein
VANETKYVKVAFEQRVDDQLGPDVALQWDGVDFDESAVTEWVRVNAPGYSPIAESGTQQGVRRELWTFSFSVFTRTGGDSGGQTTHRANEIVDLIKAAFDRHTLSVLNYDDVEQEVAQVYFNRAEVTPLGTMKQGEYWLKGHDVTYEGVLWA